MNNAINKTVCFTGHREIPMLKIHSIKRKLRKEIEKLIEQGYCYFGAGGALGFDTIAAQTVLEFRKKYSQIKLILVLPCISQADRWSEQDRQLYERIKNQADKVVYTSHDYTKGGMFKRNRHLVDNSSICVCYLTEDSGGTAYTVNYAKKTGRFVINIAEDEMHCAE